MDIYIYAAGGHSKVILDILHCQGKNLVAIVDDAPPVGISHIHGIPLLHSSSLANILTNNSRWIVAIGNNRTRKKVSMRLQAQGYQFTSAIHPSARIALGVTIGEGTVVMANTVINTDATIGNQVIINTGATVDHDCEILDYSHIAPGCSLCGQVKTGEGSLLGVGTKVIPLTTIGEWTTCGAGSVVNKSLPAFCVAYGCPAKVHKTLAKL